MSSRLRVEHHPSPNHGPRAEGATVDILLLHYTGMESAEKALAWLANAQSKVSSHYFVFEDGRIVQLVPEDRRAWHAGVSAWGDVGGDINSRSIGIEIANPGHRFGYRKFPARQMKAVMRLCRAILERHAIPARNVLAHSDVAPRRKEDPGELFPWKALWEEGIGHWVEAEPIRDGAVLIAGDSGPAVAKLRKRFRTYGYALGAESLFDDDMAAVVRAFQRHFRPALVDGIADVSTIRTLDRLIAALGKRA